MISWVVFERMLSASLMVVGFGLGSAATAYADPGWPTPPTPQPTAATSTASTPTTLACRQFAGAVRVSSVHYNQFAYAIAGNGVHVDYRDPMVGMGNVDGRTALRTAAGEAMNAASIPAVPPEIANPMRSWSWRAAKLAVIMGLRGNGDTLNTAATELNAAASDAEMACASAGAQPVRGER